MKYEIAVVVINYNSSSYTIDCIRSILDKTSAELLLQIIIVDNASAIEDYEKLEVYTTTLGDKVKLVRSRINTGFGGGNMIGANFCNAPYLAFINNDTIFENDCLSILRDHLQQNPDCGIAGPQGYKEDGKLLPTIDHFASVSREIFGRKFLESINPGRYPKRKKEYDQPVKADFIAGSFMFLRSEDFYKIGGFDTNIFLYYEETDLCKRLLKLGKHAYLVPKGKFMHYHGASTEKSLAIKIELKISLLYVIRKHYGLLKFWILLLYFQIRYFFSSLFKPKYFKLWFVFLNQAHLSNSLKHTQQIQSK